MSNTTATVVDLQIRPIRDADVETVVALWNACGLTRLHNNPQDDITQARLEPCSEILVGWHGQNIIASIMVGHDGHRGCVYYVSVHPDQQDKGIGQQIMKAAEAWLEERGIRKMNVMIRTSNRAVQAFYAGLGYEPAEIAVMSKWLRTDEEKR